MADIKIKTSPHRKDYLCIVAWGKHMGSFNYYIDNQCDLAAKMGAPRTAIYERDGRWITAEEISRPELREEILKAARL